MEYGDKVTWSGNGKDARITEISPDGTRVGLQFADWSERGGIPIAECTPQLGGLIMAPMPDEGTPLPMSGLPLSGARLN